MPFAENPDGIVLLDNHINDLVKVHHHHHHHHSAQQKQQLVNGAVVENTDDFVGSSHLNNGIGDSFNDGNSSRNNTNSAPRRPLQQQSSARNRSSFNNDNNNGNCNSNYIANGTKPSSAQLWSKSEPAPLPVLLPHAEQQHRIALLVEMGIGSAAACESALRSHDWNVDAATTFLLENPPALLPLPANVQNVSPPQSSRIASSGQPQQQQQQQKRQQQREVAPKILKRPTTTTATKQRQQQQRRQADNDDKLSEAEILLLVRQSDEQTARELSAQLEQLGVTLAPAQCLDVLHQCNMRQDAALRFALAAYGVLEDDPTDYSLVDDDRSSSSSDSDDGVAAAVAAEADASRGADRRRNDDDDDNDSVEQQQQGSSLINSLQQALKLQPQQVHHRSANPLSAQQRSSVDAQLLEKEERVDGSRNASSGGMPVDVNALFKAASAAQTPVAMYAARVASSPPSASHNDTNTLPSSSLSTPTTSTVTSTTPGVSQTNFSSPVASAAALLVARALGQAPPLDGSQQNGSLLVQAVPIVAPIVAGSQPPTIMDVDAPNAKLQAMGFEPRCIADALRANNGDFVAALNSLLAQ